MNCYSDSHARITVMILAVNYLIVVHLFFKKIYGSYDGDTLSHHYRIPKMFTQQLI